jgi:hypothetical protein
VSHLEPGDGASRGTEDTGLAVVARGIGRVGERRLVTDAQRAGRDLNLITLSRALSPAISRASLRHLM